MRDPWTRIVADRLAALELPDDERNDVIEEVAAHLQECADELEAAGVTDAADRTLAQVSDWPQLAARIRRAKEKRMNPTGVDVLSPVSRSTSQRRMWAWAVTITVLMGVVGGFITSWLMPMRYRSQAVIQVVPPQIPNEYVRAPSPRPLDDRIRAVTQTVLSRTRLERVINEFNLYQEERASRTMEEVVADFRTNISIQPEAAAGSSATANTVTVSYTGLNPTTVMKVTEKLAAYLRDLSQVEGERRAEATVSFLMAQSEEFGQRLQTQQARIAASHTIVDRRTQMETQALESTYAKLLTDLEQARMQVDIERRQIGEQFNLLDQARLPQLPIGPTRAECVGLGAAAGLSLGVLIALVLTITRLWSSNRPQPAIQVA
jgi:uncharacterized protein involved in exopolysaccharide biosynthesis